LRLDKDRALVPLVGPRAPTVAVFTAVFINFMSCSRGKDVKQERRSFVATGSMILFFVFLYGLVRLHIGVIPVTHAPLQIALVAAGLSLVMFGCVVNILGRLRLGRNWANQATIYRDQRLVVAGVIFFFLVGRRHIAIGMLFALLLPLLAVGACFIALANVRL